MVAPGAFPAVNHQGFWQALGERVYSVIEGLDASAYSGRVTSADGTGLPAGRWRRARSARESARTEPFMAWFDFTGSGELVGSHVMIPISVDWYQRANVEDNLVSQSRQAAAVWDVATALMGLRLPGGARIGGTFTWGISPPTPNDLEKTTLNLTLMVPRS